MKIVHVITRMVRGGADENTLLTCNEQAKVGHEVHLIHGSEFSEAMLARVHPEVRLYMAPSLVRRIAPVLDVKATLEILSYLRRFPPDIVHTHTSKAGIVGRVAARAAGAKGIVHGVHILPFLNVSGPSKMLYLLLEKAVAPFTDAFVNVSEGMRDASLQYRVGAEARHYVVPSGMDLDAFRGSLPFTDEELGDALGASWTPGDKIVLMVAALEPRKRVSDFMEVFSEVVNDGAGAHMVVLGEGIEKQVLLETAHRLGIQDRVHLLGFRSDVGRWIATAAVCTLASEREGLPRVIVQYVLGGRPVLATDLPGVDRVVRCGVNGFLVPVDQLHLMSAHLSDLLGDEAGRQRMAEASASMDLSPWSVENMARGLEEVYAVVMTR